MSISSISSYSSAYQTDAQNSTRSQRAASFKALANALQTGDLAGAQTAFASLQPKNSSQATQQPPQTQLGKDFQALSTALSSGDVSTAQQAFANLQTDMQKAGGAHGHHHHHQETDASSTATSSATDSTTTLNTLA